MLRSAAAAIRAGRAPRNLQATDRFFLRPEVRVRRYFDDEPSVNDDLIGFDVSYEATDYEASVVFGWRFGS